MRHDAHSVPTLSTCYTILKTPQGCSRCQLSQSRTLSAIKRSSDLRNFWHGLSLPLIDCRARRNIANFEMRHVDTEESETDAKAAATKQDENQSSASEDWRFEGQEDLAWNLDQRQGDDAMSSSSEGWSFKNQQQCQQNVVGRKKTARGLQFLDDPLAKAPSVQELVEGAESLVRMRPKCAIER